MPYYYSFSTWCPFPLFLPQEFLYTDPALALEYYMLAADALGGSVQASTGCAAGPAGRGSGTVAGRSSNVMSCKQWPPKWRHRLPCFWPGRPAACLPSVCVHQCPNLPPVRVRARLQVKGQLLRELLVESKAFGYLLGSGGAGALLHASSHACMPA